MSTIYNKLQNDFTIINNHIIQDNRVSGNAFKLYCYIVFRLGRNPEWEFISYEILIHFKEGKKALKTARDELINFGYLKCLGQKHRVNGDFGGNDYEIYSTPACYPEGSTLQRQTLQGLTHKGSTNKNEYNKTELKKDINKNITTASGLSSLENSNVIGNEKVKNQTGTQTGKNAKNLPYSFEFQEWYIIFAEPLKSIDWNKKTKRFDGLYRQFQARLKEMDLKELMQNTKDYLKYKSIETSGTSKMGAEIFLNGKCQNDYRQLINDILRKNGKTLPIAQKTPEEQQEEVKIKEDIQSKLEVIKSRLNAKEKEFNTYIKEFLRNIYGNTYDIHYNLWLKNMIIKCRDRTVTVGVFKSIDNHWQKLQDILNREMQSKGFEFEKIEWKLID